MQYLKELKTYLPNLLGPRNTSNYVIFHSDDWGSIRTPSNNVREKLSRVKGIKNDTAYDYFDTLATSEDLEALFDVLVSVKDINGNHPVISANTVMSNPDFTKIREHRFQHFFYESLMQTFERYNNTNSLDLWDEGRESGLFYPQFHGREHVNAMLWLEYLKNGSKPVLNAFDLECFGVSFPELTLRKGNFQAAWEYNTHLEKDYVNHSIIEGLELFNKHFGFRSKTAIAPSYTWTATQEKICNNNGVIQMQGIVNQKIPEKESYRLKKRYQSVNFQMRNAFFEPSISKDLGKEEVLRRAEIIFSLNKPLIISSHRLNFVGALNVQNRNNNLVQLKEMLSTLVSYFPDVKFVNAAEFADIQNKGKIINA